MSPALLANLRAWIDRRDVIEAQSADNIVGLARHIVAEFFGDHPEHRTNDLAACDEILHAMARHLGHESAVSWLGTGRCQSNGFMTLEISKT